MNATIAVVDNQASVLDAIKMVLESAGWSVWAYTTGEAFLADIRRNNIPSCLILDPHLPGINGVEFVKIVLNCVGLAALPIIVLTARPGSLVMTQLNDTGDFITLTKPVSADELINQVQIAIQDAVAR